MKSWLAVALVVGALVIAAQFITIFVVQPIGALPDGRTLIITRLTTMNFIDSADAWCARKNGGVNLICRAALMGVVGSKSTILVRLPYSATLYGISTGGVTYDR